MTLRSARYTTVAIGLHWLIAAMIVFQIILGWRVSDAPKGPAVFALLQLHKSVGITILVLTLARIAWRLGHRPPPAPADQPQWEQVAARLTHIGFYGILIGLPLSGWVMVSASRLNLPTLLYGVVPWPHLPGVVDLPPAAKAAWRTGGALGHGLLVKLTYGLLALHLGAVAKHQLFDRDGVFARMAPGAAPGWREPRAWIAATLFGVVVALACLYRPVATKPAPANLPAAPAVAAITPSVPTVATVDASRVPPAPPRLAEGPAKPVDWRVQPGARLGFTASWGGDPVEGVFTGWTARIRFSPDALDSSRLEVSVDPATVSTGDGQRDATVAGPDFLDAKAKPVAVFTATKFRKLGDGHYVAVGRLDLRGVSRPLELPFSLRIKGDTVVASGSVAVNRTDFGVGQGEWAATDQIAAAVRVSFQLTARTAPH